jgi:hypothetical protein
VNVAILLVAAFLAQGTDPALKPEDYPVSKIFSGKPAAPKLVTSGQRRFRTMIRDGAKKGTNFAGHYVIAEWGCGTGCEQIAVVDARAGDVYDGPFGKLPQGTVLLDLNSRGEPSAIFYRRDSSLLIVKGCPNEKNCATYYYSWTGTQFKLLRKDP